MKCDIGLYHQISLHRVAGPLILDDQIMSANCHEHDYTATDVNERSLEVGKCGYSSQCHAQPHRIIQRCLGAHIETFEFISSSAAVASHHYLLPQ